MLLSGCERSGRPGDGGVQLAWPARPAGPLHGAADQTRPLQHLEMNPGSRPVQPDGRRQLPDVQRLLRGLQDLQQPAPG